MMKRILLALFAFTLSLLGQNSSPAARRITAVEGVYEYRLDNGLTVLLVPDAADPKVLVHVTYRVGSNQENRGEEGMSHFLEHMMFKGTPTNRNIMKLLSEHGATWFNGRTGHTTTTYWESMAADPDTLNWSLGMEADRMVNASILPEDLASEITVVANEYQQQEDRPRTVLFNRTIAAAFERHNYGKAARGDMTKVSVERLRAYYRRYYQPDNAMLIVAGNFDEQNTLRRIGETFGKIPRPDRVIGRLEAQETTQDGEHMIQIRRAGGTPMIMLMYHLPPAAHEDYAPAELFLDIIGNASAGRLATALVGSKKASQVQSDDIPHADTSAMYVVANVGQGRSIDEVREEMIRAIEGAATNAPPTEEEVVQAKTRLLDQFEQAASKSDELANALSGGFGIGDWRMP